MTVRVIERIYSVGPWLTQPVTAIVACDPSDVAGLPGVEWHGEAQFCGGEYRAHLVGRDVTTANAIMALGTKSCCSLATKLPRRTK